MLETRLTDAGNSQRIYQMFGGALLYCAANHSWYRYTLNHWMIDQDGYVVRCAKTSAAKIFEALADAEPQDRKELYTHARRSESARGIRDAIQLLECELAVKLTDFDSDDFAFGVGNGEVNLKAGILQPHSRESKITRLAPFDFDPKAKCPLWLKFLDRIMAGNADLIGYLQRVSGLCATGDATIQEMFIFHGSGANGKSVFIDTLSYILGDHAGVAPDSLLIIRNGGSEHPTEIAGLCGKRLVVTSETESGGQLRLQLVKKLTGDEMLTGRFMRCDYFTFRRTFKLVMVTNNRPKITESTEAVWRRIRLIRFDVTIPTEERDPDLLAKLKAEAPGILNWIIEGSISRLRDGMRPPAEVLAATDNYKAEADPLADFLSTECLMADFAKVPRAELWTAYQQWAKAAGERDSMDRGAFYDRIRRLDGVDDLQWRAGGAPVRGFVGIGLCHSTEPQYQAENGEV